MPQRLQIKHTAKTKPVMSAELERQVHSAIAQFINMRTWKEWGMSSLRQQGSALLMSGPPGTGKSTIAIYLSQTIGRGMLSLNMKDVGGKAPGDTERKISEIFSNGKLGGNKTIYMDECEALLWNRARAGSDSMWMVGVIDELLMQIAVYSGMVILATNNLDVIDEALFDRLFAHIRIGFPERPERLRLWEQKMPDRFPLQLSRIQIELLADIALSGRQIENAIVKEASNALTDNRLPEFVSLCNVAKSFVK